MCVFRKIAAMFCAAAIVLSLAGCTGVSVSELYSLPEFSEEHLQLQDLINAEISAGCEYLAPTSGSYRQSVQLWDLTGDGRQEALAFFQTPELTPKICIYHASGDDYYLAETINGEGSAIRSLEYADMNSDGSVELIVSWQVSSDLRLLKVYSLKNLNSSVLLTVDCAEFLSADMDSDGATELLVIQPNTGSARSVTMYALGSDNEMVSSVAFLSDDVVRLTRMRTGLLSDGASALFVESEYENSRVATDIFAVVDDQLKNIVLRPATENTSMLRSLAVYSTDIDNDRVMEVPTASRLYSQSESSSQYWMLNWYSLDSSGNRARDISTYHCYSDGWYYIIPDALRHSFTVRRADSISGERVVILSSVDKKTDQVTDLLTIYTLTGENRHDRARLPGRFVLQESASTIYAARISSAELTEETVKKSFKLIYTEWMTGAL